MAEQTMYDFEKEIEESLKHRQRYNDPDAGKWDKFKEYIKDESIQKVKISEVVNGGLVTYLDEVRAFIPASQISMSYVENLNEYQGKNLEVVVITADDIEKRLILSHRKIEEKEKLISDKNAFENLKIGDVLTGKVETLKEYGAFVKLSNGLSGLLHISQISTKRIKHPKVVLKVGEEVNVKVIDIKDGKISLSIKALEENNEEIYETEEVFDYVETGRATTSFGDLLKDLKF